ncbi:hypothetical protein COOONC_09573 [Cooperia oncophora]
MPNEILVTRTDSRKSSLKAERKMSGSSFNDHLPYFAGENACVQEVNMNCCPDYKNNRSNYTVNIKWLEDDEETVKRWLRLASLSTCKLRLPLLDLSCENLSQVQIVYRLRMRRHRHSLIKVRAHCLLYRKQRCLHEKTRTVQGIPVRVLVFSSISLSASAYYASCQMIHWFP